MKSALSVLLSLVILFHGQAASADPIHAVANGGYWHHGSGWVFPAKIGEFVLVGIPQDVAGSTDAVAYYARIADGARITASVDLYAADSVSAEAVSPDNLGTSSSKSMLPLDKSGALTATRVKDVRAGELTAVYLVTAGEWRVRIRVSGAPAGTEPAMDAFVLGQRWDTLTSAPTPR
jgi:hypothetical protein